MSDPRVLRTVPKAPGQPVKLTVKHALRKPPTGEEVEVERSLWGKHPDPVQAWVEDALFDVGHAYLRGLISAVLGQREPDEFKTVAKAEPLPKPPGWGEVMALFKSPAAPEQKMATWSSLIDTFSKTLLPPTTAQNQIAMWALRSSLLNTISERVHAITTPGAWDKYFSVLPPAQKEQVKWAQAKGAQYVTNMKAKARESVMNALVESQTGGANHHELSRVLFERLGALNRDWRRIAITETAMAVSAGQLLTALGSGGDWEAVWTAGPRACNFCKAQNGRVLKVVADDKPDKDYQNEVWSQKSNVGRSASLHRKDGSKRGPEELWVPVVPAHPNCCCVYALRRVVTSKAAKALELKLAESRAKAYAKAAG